MAGAGPLYVTDLDGTLLASDGVLSDRAAELLTALIERGVRITYATARSAEKAKSMLDAVPFELPAIVLNGAMLVDAKTGKTIHAEALVERTASRLLELCARWEPVRTCSDEKTSATFSCGPRLGTLHRSASSRAAEASRE